MARSVQTSIVIWEGSDPARREDFCTWLASIHRDAMQSAEKMLQLENSWKQSVLGSRSQGIAI